MIRLLFPSFVFLIIPFLAFNQDSTNKKMADLKPIEPFHYHLHTFSSKNNVTYYRVGNDTVLNLKPYLIQVPECAVELRKVRNANISGLVSFGLGIASLTTMLSLKHDAEREQYINLNLIPLCGMIYFPIVRKIHLKRAIKIYNAKVTN